jgi:hypothetical protein
VRAAILVLARERDTAAEERDALIDLVKIAQGQAEAATTRLAAPLPAEVAKVLKRAKGYIDDVPAYSYPSLFEELTEALERMARENGRLSALTEEQNGTLAILRGAQNRESY